MRCPYCQTEDTRVIETRTSEEQATIRRRRECQDCRRRFTTYERHEEPQLFVIKKDGRREPFDRAKLLHGLTKASEKRPISREAIDELCYDIERTLRDALKDEVRTSFLGDMVLRRLRDIDEVAYIRFASVYREFKDLRSYVEETERMVAQSRQERIDEEQRSLFDG
ncbi:MAG: transcriptional regulator NrdR [bacterium]